VSEWSRQPLHEQEVHTDEPPKQEVQLQQLHVEGSDEQQQEQLASLGCAKWRELEVEEGTPATIARARARLS
jgi:hypothetical protein